ncbi:MAG: hypothetical protein CMB80_10100 [Flammeovirgaceae bacterium]|nr:hypothetical protein [Flammeovirgaceae bacterium]MBE61117.1 hypothetical protein [Flammeovirgaceae bacterium]MBR08271.1 hypothetical protein [Rickettsiales bacterium]HCX21843.1 hypothetical protein [Cytophagales bacterium]|tara:strand:- start:6826 stop:7302 length:477 start_codon:yes stop_codon:yes gene_type:complete
MITATIKQIKDELKFKEKEELVELCLSLARFKKESKELLTYLLFEAQDEASYISGVKAEITEGFMDMNTSNIYFVKKSVRKILRETKKYIRYSKNKHTQVELILHFLYELNNAGSYLKKSTQLKNLYNRELLSTKKVIKSLHEDLQFDFEVQLKELTI